MKLLFSKTLQRKFFISIFFAIFFINSNGLSTQEFRHEVTFATHKKIYVTPEQVEITDNGILFYNNPGEDPYIGKLLSCDKEGLYIELARISQN